MQAVLANFDGRRGRRDLDPCAPATWSAPARRVRDRCAQLVLLDDGNTIENKRAIVANSTTPSGHLVNYTANGALPRTSSVSRTRGYVSARWKERAGRRTIAS